MRVTVKVLRDAAGIYSTGYNRSIPTDVQILGMVTIEDPCMPGSAVQMLRISHQSFQTWLGIEGTANELIDKINLAVCCDESGGLLKLPTPPIGVLSASSNTMTVPFTGIPTPPPGVIYQVQASSNGWMTVAGYNSGPVSPIQIGGLPNGILYKGRVRATAPGYQPSDWSEAALGVTPLGLPKAPPPTAGFVDDVADTFSFLPDPAFPLPSDYEYSILGSPYAPMTAFPLYVGNIDAAPGTVSVRTKGVPGTTDPSIAIVNQQPFTRIANAVFVYYLAEPTNNVPTEAYIVANAQKITVPAGADYRIPFSNTTAMYLKVFERATEPAKTKNGETGIAGDAFGPQGLFPAGSVTTGTLRGYISQYKTIANVATLEFNA